MHLRHKHAASPVLLRVCVHLYVCSPCPQMCSHSSTICFAPAPQVLFFLAHGLPHGLSINQARKAAEGKVKIGRTLRDQSDRPKCTHCRSSRDHQPPAVLHEDPKRQTLNPFTHRTHPLSKQHVAVLSVHVCTTDFGGAVC